MTGDARTRHVFRDGFCIWCGTPVEKAHTVNCPMCPYDDGLAYLNEVDKP